MIPTEKNIWLHRFAVLTALATLALIGIGGLVTSHEAGMSVPDWPTSYGYNMFLFPVSKWWHGGNVFYEHSHRLVASTVGLLTAILALWLWMWETNGKARRNGVLAIVGVLLVVGGMMGVRTTTVFVSIALAGVCGIVFGVFQLKRTDGLRWLGIVALSAVVLQGVLGGLRVTLLKDELGIFHATLAQLFFVLVSSIALFTSKWWKFNFQSAIGYQPSAIKNLRGLFLLTSLVIFVQLILGAAMRHQHAGLAIPDFPLAYGKVWPAMDALSVARYNQQRQEVTETHPITAGQIGLQMAHRIVAVLILVAVAVCAIASKRKLGWGNRITKLATCWLGLLLLQATLGALTVLRNKPADIATLHVLAGAMTLVTGAMLVLISSRILAAGEENTKIKNSVSPFPSEARHTPAPNVR